MCDDKQLHDIDDYVSRNGDLTRRQFGTLTVGTGLAMLLPRAANAQAVSESDVEITTADGVADAYFVHPSAGSYPGVLIWPDAVGLRPAFRMMGRRLAESGYSVLVVNPYYRNKRAPVLPEGATFQDPGSREIVMPLMASLSSVTHLTDARTFVSFLDAQPSVDSNRMMGTMGYCMGGPITMRTAAARPDRIGAGASFHGGGLVSDAPSSPHLLVPNMRAQYLFAVAENDDMSDPAAKNVLRQSFTAASLPAEIEVYAGTLHGWCPPDSAVYHEAQAERAWSRMLALFSAALT